MIILTWNIQWCRGVDGRVDPVRIIETARACADFDVLCLQEVSDGFPGLAGSRGENQFAILASLLPDYHAIEGVAVDVADARGQRQRFGNLMLSRLPVGAVWRHLLPWPADPSVATMQRVVIEAVVQAPTGPVRVMTTHLEYYSASQRMAQVEQLRHLQSEACAHQDHPPRAERRGNPFETRLRPCSAVLTGDFNFRVDAPDYAALQSPLPSPSQTAPAHGWRDAWRLAYPGQAHDLTNGVHDREQWPSPYTCDFIFVTEDLAPRVRSVRVDLQTQASDHQPLWVELS